MSSSAGEGGAGAGGAGAGGAGAGGVPGTEIITSNGVVLAGTNDVGIAGPWAMNYPAGSTLNYITSSPAFAMAGSQVCVTGYVGAGNTATEWGAALSLALNQAAGTYTPSAHGLLGFGFTVTGSNVPAYLQLGYVQADGTQYCTLMVTGPGAHTFYLSNATYDCWNGGGAVASPNMDFQLLWIQVRSSAVSTFDFCVTNVHAIVQ
jgi:hypothetical protein